MKVIDDNFLVCGFCLQAIVNDDYTALDYYFTPEVADNKMELIKAGMASAIPDDQTFIAPTDDTIEFSTTSCECCGDPLHGDRTRMEILQTPPYPYTERSYYK